MKTIWKFTLETTDEQFVQMPDGAEILSVQSQFDEPQLWALVDSEKERVNRLIRIIGTGHPIENSFEGKFIGTYQLLNGNGVFHVFDVGRQ